MDADVQTYLDGIATEHRPLSDRMHRLTLRAYPDAGLAPSYGMPAYRAGDRRPHAGVWRHGVSVDGREKGRATGFVSRHPDLVSGKGTIRLRSPAAAALTDDESGDLVRASLET
ncbi:DUF1801 domain-containing protein [Streptomyces sediminimaris]|uniref:DUF1801 domain-containing protein n=1 Tax=Streptomyces sediminimaris TaxID=3383721 RepID=UPI00399A4725